MVALNGKRIDHVRFLQELVAAGINVGAIGTNGDQVHTYDANGNIVDLPAGAAAVVAAHVQTPDPINYTGLTEEKYATVTAGAVSSVLIRLPMSPLTGYKAAVEVVAFDRANGTMKTWDFKVDFKRLNGGGLGVGPARFDAGSPNADSGGAATTSGVANWTIVPSIDGNDGIVTVTGHTGRTVDWGGFVRFRRFRPAGVTE